jgi:hypothetical protein
VIKLPQAPERYDKPTEEERNRQIESEFRNVYKRDEDLEITGGNSTRDQRLILKSPNGTRWKITVSNAGTISATSL